MPKESLPQTQSSPSPPPPGNGGLREPPDEVCLTNREWQEISDCSLALHAAIHHCQGLEGDEPAELVKSVEMRFVYAVHAIERRVFGK